jgi:hypothetical protein
MPNIERKGYSARDLGDVGDSPELTKEDLAMARPFAEALPELAASIRKGRGTNKARACIAPFVWSGNRRIQS